MYEYECMSNITLCEIVSSYSFAFKFNDFSLFLSLLSFPSL